jgi:TPR repeat protein
MQDKILKSYQDSADRNEPYGWLRLGECYRDGELGVEKDLAKAKVYLTKAADAGSTTAANELSKLSQ